MPNRKSEIENPKTRFSCLGPDKKQPKECLKGFARLRSTSIFYGPKNNLTAMFHSPSRSGFEFINAQRSSVDAVGGVANDNFIVHLSSLIASYGSQTLLSWGGPITRSLWCLRTTRGTEQSDR